VRRQACGAGDAPSHDGNRSARGVGWARAGLGSSPGARTGGERRGRRRLAELP